MIDLHSHILPGIDDGAPNLDVSIEMAQIAVSDGITHMVCTPHIIPGVYENAAPMIADAVAALGATLASAAIPLKLFVGADVHITPDLPEKLGSGSVPTLNGSRYFLFEPTHHILPPRIEELAARLIKDGFIPILTHPERLTWITSHFAVIERLHDLGCLVQLTAGSIAGSFGRTARYYSEKLIDEGRVDVVASDAHGAIDRRPGLSQALSILAKRIGDVEAQKMVLGRPAAILSDKPVEPSAAAMQRLAGEPRPKRFGALGRMLKGIGS